MHFMCCGDLPKAHPLSSDRDGPIFGHQQVRGLAAILRVAVLGIGLVASMAGPGRAASLDEAAEQYRSCLIQDVDRTVMSVQKLRASVAANDLAGAKQAWIDARIG
jgi:iron uptake system component EfeO